MQTLKRLIPQAIKNQLRPAAPPQPQESVLLTAESPTYQELAGLMARYTTDQLVNITPEAFKARIDGFLALDDYAMEGFSDPDRQRDMSIKFVWGHNHDFGTFKLRGQMRDRHLKLLATYIEKFNALPRVLEGKRVLDIGCWTGGTSLLLHAMGAEVVAIEEVRKYIECLTYLKEAFGLDRLTARPLSLYDCTTGEFQDAFDVVLYAGVIYHVTDPVLSLRIAFNCLKDGGVCLVETAANASNRPVLDYEGPTQFFNAHDPNVKQSGWNWFIPSVPALTQMMSDVGFTDIQATPAVNTRAAAVGWRRQHVDIMRGGLSVRTVR